MELSKHHHDFIEDILHERFNEDIRYEVTDMRYSDHITYTFITMTTYEDEVKPILLVEDDMKSLTYLYELNSIIQ